MFLIRKNYIYNPLIDFSNTFAFLVALPCAIRGLEFENIGRVNFMSSTVVFHFGILPCDITELSKAKDNQVLFRRKFHELVSPNVFPIKASKYLGIWTIMLLVMIFRTSGTTSSPVVKLVVYALIEGMIRSGITIVTTDHFFIETVEIFRDFTPWRGI